MKYAIGEPLREWTRRTDLMNWNRYAAVNDEFYGIHMDDDIARAAGNASGAFGMGNLRYAYIVNALRTWFGDDAEILEVSCRYRAINQKGDLLQVRGTIDQIEKFNGSLLLIVSVDIFNQNGQSTCPGAARVAVYAE